MPAHLCTPISVCTSISTPCSPQVFPLFQALGANGLLIEYEDMFPYEGRLQLLRARHAYRYPMASVCSLTGVPEHGRLSYQCAYLGECEIRFYGGDFTVLASLPLLFSF